MTKHTIVRGDKYVTGLDIAEIAKRVRAEIKAAVKAGSLPELTASVTMRRYTGGRSLSVRITKCSIPVLNVARVRVEMAEPHRYNGMPHYNPEAAAVLDTIRGICDAYNFDGSDIGSDYFHVNFYTSVGIDWQIERDERTRIEANAHLDARDAA